MISEVTRLVLPVLFNDLDIAHLNKSFNILDNVMEHHPVEIKASGGHGMSIKYIGK